jgi:hypothetical protein
MTESSKMSERTLRLNHIHPKYLAIFETEMELQMMKLLNQLIRTTIDIKFLKRTKGIKEEKEEVLEAFSFLRRIGNLLSNL